MPVSANPFPATEEVLHGVTVADPYGWLEAGMPPRPKGGCTNKAACSLPILSNAPISPN